MVPNRHRQTTFLSKRWQQLWLRLGAQRIPDLAPLLRRLQESHRHYHSLTHIRHCLRTYDNGPMNDDAVELALWFHDAIYDTHAHDNEAQSAAWCHSIAESVGIDEKLIVRVKHCINATCHHRPPQNIDEALCVAVDLSILSETPQRFQEYDRAIRKEYAWVPIHDYRRERARVLKIFLTRSLVYPHPWFERRLGKQARFNLRSSLIRLNQN